MKYKNNKQNKTNKEKLINKQNSKFGIIGFTCLIILLIFILVLFLYFNTGNKSDSKKIMNNYNKYFNSSEEKVILYYSSKADNQAEINMEKMYLKQLSSDYNFDYLDIDASVLNKKNRNKIENDLGISETYPSIAIVKENKVMGISEGFIESHNLTKLLISVNILPNDAKYKYISNLNFVDYKQYKKLLKNKNMNIVVIGQSACEYCNSVKPILNNISRAYDLDINYVDVKDYSKKDLQELFDNLPKIGYDDETLTESGSFSMPTVLLIKNGKIKDYIKGEKTLEEYISNFKKNKVIE